MAKPIRKIGPPCKCHGEGQCWNPRKDRPTGGYWTCRVKRREQKEAESRKNGRAVFGSPEYHERLHARFLGKKHPPNCGHCAAQTGERSASWRGDDIGYVHAHRRHRQALAGWPCAFADSTCKGRLTAALRHETPISRLLITPRGANPVYTTNSEDYMPLCASHHTRYDVFFVWPFAARDRWTVSHPTA